MVLNANSKNVHHTNLYPSVHPSPRVPDVLPEDGTPACTPYIFAPSLPTQAPPLNHLPCLN